MRAYLSALIRRHPYGVFFLAIPLFSLGMGSMAALAVFKFRNEGDPVFLIIWLLGLCLFLMAMLPVVRYLRRC